MPVPASLTVEDLKRRLDRQLSTDDDLLEQLLEEAFEQAQAAPPNGCGRLLTPDPVLVGDPGEDTGDPVQKTIATRARRIAIPDAREITEVLIDDVAAVEGVPYTGYEPVLQDGLVVALSLPHPHWCGYAGGGWTDSVGGYGFGSGGGCTCRAHRRVVKVTGRFGFLEIPATLKGAIYTLAARMYYERDAGYADQVAVAEGAPLQAYYRQLPPRVKLAFSNFAPPAGVLGLQ